MTYLIDREGAKWVFKIGNGKQAFKKKMKEIFFSISICKNPFCTFLSIEMLMKWQTVLDQSSNVDDAQIGISERNIMADGLFTGVASRMIKVCRDVASLSCPVSEVV